MAKCSVVWLRIDRRKGWETPIPASQAIKALGKRRAMKMQDVACEKGSSQRYRKSKNIDIVAKRGVYVPRPWRLKGY